jgi:hypothetical protein
MFLKILIILTNLKLDFSNDCKFYGGLQLLSNEYTIFKNEVKSNYTKLKSFS